MAKQDEMRNDGMQEMNDQELDKVVGGLLVPHGGEPQYEIVRCSTPGCRNEVTIDIRREDMRTAKCRECQRREKFTFIT